MEGEGEKGTGRKGGKGRKGNGGCVGGISERGEDEEVRGGRGGRERGGGRRWKKIDRSFAGKIRGFVWSKFSQRIYGL